MKYILAIDSGATKSEVLLYPLGEKSGNPFNPNVSKPVLAALFRGKKPFINLNLLGFNESLKRLKTIVNDASKKAGKGNITAVSAGISGARYESDRKKIASSLKKATGIKNVFILPDTEIALAASFEDNEKNCGILIAGTGSILYYRASDGKINRIGGWGRHIGDEGSGHWIAREALYKVTKHYDKRHKARMLSVVIKKEFGIDQGNIIKHVYHKGFEISKLTKHVFRCAERGDKVCKDIIKSAAENLLTHFIPLKKKKYRIAMMGSLLTEEKLLAIELKKGAKKLYPNIMLVDPEFKPVWGAVKIAMAKSK
ncbi:MAG: BadF/BadG/BcrA/BcrD ATPase family protein [Ignavibacteria bacterium]